MIIFCVHRCWIFMKWVLWWSWWKSIIPISGQTNKKNKNMGKQKSFRSKAVHFVSDLTTVFLNPISDKPSNPPHHPHGPDPPSPTVSSFFFLSSICICSCCCDLKKKLFFGLLFFGLKVGDFIVKLLCLYNWSNTHFLFDVG